MKKRFFPYLAIGLIVLLVVIALVPTILSTNVAKDQVLKVINRRVSGQLRIDQWSLGWLGGIDCQGVAYKNDLATISVRVDRIAVSKGLLALAFNYRKPGLIKIARPQGIIGLPGKEPSPSSASEVSTAGKAPSHDVNNQSREKAGQFALPPIVAEIKITDGSIKVVYSNGKDDVIAKDIMITFSLNEPGKPIPYRLLARAGKGAGQISGQGSFLIPSEGAAGLGGIQSDANISIKDWNLAPLLALGSALSGAPSGNGMLNGQFQVQGDPASGLHLTGQLAGTDIRLTGGKLASDTPSLKKITCDIDAVQTDTEWTIKGLVIDSPLFRGSVKGHRNNRGESWFQTQAVLDLAGISAQLPATLNLKPGTRITHGQVEIKAKVESNAQITRFDGDIRLDRLAGISGKKKLAWNEPLAATAVGSYGVDGIQLDKFSIQSAFLSGKGQGGLDDLRVELKADLRTALKEAGQFIDTKGWRAAGKINLTLHAGSRPNALHFIEAALESDSLQLLHKDQVVVPRDRFNTRLKTDFQLDEKSHLRALSKTSVDFDAWLGKGRLSAERIDWPANSNRQPRVHQLVYDGTLALKPFSRMMRAMNLFPADISIAGQADISTRLSSDPTKIAFEDTAITVDRFVFRQGKQRFKDKKIDLRTRGHVNLESRSARLVPLEITAAAGKVAFPELVIDDWADLAHAVKGRGTARVDLALLAAVFESTINLPEKTKVTGRAEIEIKTDLTDARNQTLSLLCSLAPIRIDSDKGALLNEDKVNLTVDLKGDLAHNDMVIRKLAIAARPLSLTASGRISPQGKERLLSARGDLAIDLGRLQNPINALLGTDIEMSGKSERPFAVDLKTENGQWREVFKRAVLAAALHADRIDGFGLTLKSVDIPVKVEKSLARSDIRGVANEGELALRPGIDLAASPPVLSLPDDSTVLNKARITKDLANKLLALIHPIFKGTAAVQGTVDLVMHHFKWPLPESYRKEAQFAGILRFKDVKLNAEGLIYDLLTVMKVKERDTTIGDRTVEFSCKNGRIQCSPLRMKVKDYRLEVSGSMGFDGTLAYIARIPVTPELVGQKAYLYLKDTYIDIPIGGTVSKPKLNMGSFQETLKKMMGQAGGKLLEQKAGEFLKKLF